MTSFKYTAATLALFLASGLSYAANTTTATTAEQPAAAQKGPECPAVGTVAEADLSAECKNEAAMPAQDGTTTTGAAGTVQPDSNAAATTEMPKQDATAPADATTEAAVTEAKASSSVLASQFMGQTVYSAANENVGEINDIVMNRELDNVVAIIGVGGFLGIGEKDVAISIEEITAVKDENNNLKLTIAATKEQLEAAPAFDRTALK